jgi:hypothetical protein
MGNENSNTKKANPVSRIIGMVVGVALGLYCGAMVVIPLTGSLVIMLLIQRLPFKSVKPFGTAVAIIFGHLIWMIFGVLYSTVGFAALSFDLLAMLAGLIWLFFRPGLGPVILLSVYEIVSLIVNINVIRQYEIGSVGHKALTAHIAIRAFVLITLISGYVRFRKEQTAPAALPPTASDQPMPPPLPGT